jgi:hypothetical protein
LDVQECENLMDKGWKNRATGSTLMNADSSRSGIQAFQTGVLNGTDILMKIPFIEQSKSDDDFRAFRISVSRTANLGLVSNVKIDIGHT